MRTRTLTVAAFAMIASGLVMAWATGELEVPLLGVPTRVHVIERGGATWVGWDMANVGGVVQVRRLINGRKDLKWTMPVMALSRVHRGNLPERCWFRDADRYTNCVVGYRVRFKRGSETGPWSVETRPRAGDTGEIETAVGLPPTPPMP